MACEEAEAMAIAPAWVSAYAPVGPIWQRLVSDMGASDLQPPTPVLLVSGLRRVGLKGTELATAQVSTIRTKLLRIGAQIRVSVRKVWVSMASSYPWQGLYRQVWSNLRC